MAAIVRRLSSRGVSVRTGSDDGGHAPNPDPGVVAHRVPYPVTAPRGKQGQQAEDWKYQRDPGGPASPGRPEVGGKGGPESRSMLKRGRARASRNLRERGSAGRGRGVVTPRHEAAAPSIADAGGCQEMRSSNAKPGSGWATSSPSGIGSGSSPQAAGPRAGASEMARWARRPWRGSAAPGRPRSRMPLCAYAPRSQDTRAAQPDSAHR